MISLDSWVHPTVIRIQMHSDDIQMIFRWYSWVWFSVVANHGEMLRCHLKTIHSGSFYRSIRDKQSPSETRKFKTELRKFTISKNIDNIHIVPAVKPSQTSTAICCWKASSLLPKPVLRLSNMLKMIESFASWESCKTVGVRTSYASSYARFANLQESAASCVCDVIVAPKGHRTQHEGQELSFAQVHRRYTL